MRNQKMCNFYVSEFHLLTVLMPYIDEKISENREVELISQIDLSEKVKLYLKKIERFEENKILKLGWRKNRKDCAILRKYRDIAIVIGDEEFVNEVNEVLDKKENKIEIVNCYNVESIKNLKQIVSKHDFVLKTSGINEVTKSSHNEQKRKTIQSQI